jgi:hypothetical protein
MKMLLALLLFPIFVHAQQDNGPFGGMPAQNIPFPEWEEHGQLITIRIVPADKETHLYLVGKEAAALKSDDMRVTAKVFSGKTEHTLTFVRNKDHFTAPEAVNGDVQVQVHDTKKDQPVDQVKFHIVRP